MKKVKKHYIKKFFRIPLIKWIIKGLKSALIVYLLIGSIIFMLKNQSLGTYCLVFFMVALVAYNIVGYFPNKHPKIKKYKEIDDL